MESYPGVTPLWDLSQASSFSQLPDEDFLALLQKQFPTSADGFTGSFQGGIDPQSIQPFALAGLSPQSEDSSPSPPSTTGDPQFRSESLRPRGNTDAEDPMLKRKASDDSMDDEEQPNSKNQHTVGPDRRSSTASRRKSTGANPDDNRLLKRKEQNRAAQRAFRERKEKHVKDLEDQVAALEAKNEQAVSENVNLRDLLARLQDENVTLKQAAFTFSVPKTAGSSQQPIASGSQPPMNLYNSPTAMSAPSTSFSPQPSMSSPTPSAFPESMDWTSLTTFDPAVLQLLDESPPQTTATGSAMFMDFGFGQNPPANQSQNPNQSPFTTIAANPMFMSFADFDTTDTSSNSDNNSISSFDWNAWTNSPQPDAAATKSPGLDELFGGGFQGTQGPVDFNALMMSTPSSAAISPISHRSSPGTATSASSKSSGSSASNNSQAESPASSVGASPEAESVGECGTAGNRCPRTKEETAEVIKKQGLSTFVTSPTGGALSTSEQNAVLGKIVECSKGSTLPSTEPNADNVDVLAAWRKVMQDPSFKATDMDDLCSEFSSKAKCDGTKVVIDKESYQDLLARVAKSQPL